MSPLRRWAFRAFTLLLMVGLLEIFSLVVWNVWPPMELTNLSAHQLGVAAMGSPKAGELEVLHPYLGWAFNPDTSQLGISPSARVPVNELGFADSGPSVRLKSPDRFVVGVLGGSVAQQMTTIGEHAFCERLAAQPALRGRRVEIVRLAMSGFKQPQQLMTLNYVLALGGEFDAIINLDGYNETALTIAENHGSDVFLAYPRGWHARLQDVVDPRTSSLSFRLLQSRASRQEWARWIVTSPLRHSWTVSLLWAIQDQLLNRQQINLGVELRQHSRNHGLGFARQGPRQMYSNEQEMYSRVTELWSHCSLQMHHLCAGRGIPYLHFLQPNQYHEGSKPLNAVELEKYYAPHEEFAEVIKRGYPMLIQAGRDLRENGVPFHDLTQLFSQETETIYADYFCHYNERGTNLLAEAVADELAKVVAPNAGNDIL